MMEAISPAHQSSFLQKIGHVLMASMTFYYIQFFGHLFLYECIIAVLIPLVLMLVATGSIKFRLNRTDILVLAFAFFSLMSVSAGIASMYESARYYRHMVLVPTFVYFLTRSVFRQITSLNESTLVLVICVCFQMVSIVAYYAKTGQRPVGAFSTKSLITASMLGAFAAFYFIYNIRRIETRFVSVISVILLLFVFCALLVSMTRVAVIGVLIIPPITRITLNKGLIQRFFLLSLILGTVFILSLSFLSYNPSIVRIQRPETDIERMSNYEFYLEDGRLRLNNWGQTLRVALEHPIFGHGAFAYRFARGGKASAHNIFVSSLMTSGLFGLTILFILILTTYLNLFSEYSKLPNFLALRNFIFSCLTMTIMIGMTNDFTGARILFFYWLIALSASLKEFSSHKMEPMKYK